MGSRSRNTHRRVMQRGPLWPLPFDRTQYPRLGVLQDPEFRTISLVSGGSITAAAVALGNCRERRHAASIIAAVMPIQTANVARSSAGRPVGPWPAAMTSKRTAPPAPIPPIISMPASTLPELAPLQTADDSQRIYFDTLRLCSASPSDSSL